ncbi:MAG: carboxylating nicotinate-nucleotide diphosphorylase [Candidatus Omnitrophica bacterium]|nr:carboxylating nicotinate-nucleotide diphosphorylase [Candidatus Omnitrophota bacterium]
MDKANHFFLKKSAALPEVPLDSVIRAALREDIGKGDITTSLVVPAGSRMTARIVARQECIVCGLTVAEKVLKSVDKKISFKPCAKEGSLVKKGACLARIRGNSRSILTAERVMLNFISLLSGVATRTYEFVKRTKRYKVKIVDTRKTLPGLRFLQKYAVRSGGGFNHRMGLDEMVLVKDNHIKIVGGHARLPHFMCAQKVEIEVESLKEFAHALRYRPYIIMLDNMAFSDIRKAVKLRDAFARSTRTNKILLEVSGGVQLENIVRIAATGVDLISVGALTHSVAAIDVSLEVGSIVPL